MINDIYGAGEVVCSTCRHANVCRYKEELVEVQRCVNGMTVQSNLSKTGVSKVKEAEWFKPIKVDCGFYASQENSWLPTKPMMPDDLFSPDIVTSRELKIRYTNSATERKD